MRYIYFSSSTGQCGTDGHDFEVYPDGTPDSVLDDDAWQIAKSNAEMYGIYPRSEYELLSEEELDGDDLEGDEYSDDIEGSWEEYDPDKHDCYTTTGECPFPGYPNS